MTTSKKIGENAPVEAAAFPAYGFAREVKSVLRLEGDDERRLLNKTAGQLAALTFMLQGDNFEEFRLLAAEHQDAVLGLTHDLALAVKDLAAGITPSEFGGTQ